MATRLGRHGTALTAAGKLHLRNARHARSDDPVDPACGCEVCARHTRGYLRHLFRVGEPTASRLLTIHNVAWTFALMERLRQAVAAGRLAPLRRELLAVWG
jgi:queuine tRNA-ribosyltransferase